MSGSVMGDGLTRAQVAALLHPGYPPSHASWMVETTTANAAMPAVDVLYLYPFRVYAPITVTLIGSRVQGGGAGSSLKTAVWRNNSATGRPVGVPVLGQNTGLPSVGAGNQTAAIASIFLVAGVYWGGTKTTGTPPTMLAISAPNVQVTTPTLATGAPFLGFSTPDAFANDILALDLTSATFTGIQATSIPMIGLGWA